jgi:hypothetical protein
MPDSWMLLKARMIIKLVAPLVLVALVQPASALQIRRVGTDLGVVLKLRGDVRGGDSRRLKAILQNGSIVGLQIRSTGGSLEGGLDIAQVVRDKGLAVYASKVCDSACAFIFFAAKERYVGRRCKIGVHSVSNDRGRQRLRYRPDIAASSRTRSAAFRHWQDRCDTTGQDDLSGQSRSG